MKTAEFKFLALTKAFLEEAKTKIRKKAKVEISYRYTHKYKINMIGILTVSAKTDEELDKAINFIKRSQLNDSFTLINRQ